MEGEDSRTEGREREEKGGEGERTKRREGKRWEGK